VLEIVENGVGNYRGYPAKFYELWSTNAEKVGPSFLPMLHFLTMSRLNAEYLPNET